MTAIRPPRTRAVATAVTFNLPERLDALTAEAVYAEVHRILKPGVRRLTLDAGGMAYISSRGVRALLRVREEMHRDGGVIVRNRRRLIDYHVCTPIRVWLNGSRLLRTRGGMSGRPSRLR